MTDDRSDPTTDETITDEVPDSAKPGIDVDIAVVPTDPELLSEEDDDESDGPTELNLPVLPLRGTVVFPLTVVPLAAAQARSLRLIDDVMSGDRMVCLLYTSPSPRDS